MDNDYIEVELDEELWLIDGHLCLPVVKMDGVGAPGVMTVPVVVLRPSTKLRLQVTHRA